jgi:hypothetical protein
MTSIHKIKYGSTSSHNKICNDVNATNKIIYLYKKFSKVLFPCENQGVTNLPPLKMNLVSEIWTDQKRNLENLPSTLLLFSM